MAPMSLICSLCTRQVGQLLLETTYGPRATVPDEGMQFADVGYDSSGSSGSGLEDVL